ncbi:multidrug MFS transporter [Paracoccus sphaerophysae]|uniref:Multidrug MFS transporter n=2 Tax=Paracoccus sphaerophysae TaxID=690417 RepID=A0A099FGH7_9RHOB|nr:multidrug MFS transporter [Paracoccus sphaerophysae]
MTAAVEDTPQNRARAWRNLAVLMTAQGLIGAQISMVFITAGLAGAMIAPSRCLATLPISMVTLGSALSARFLSGFMARHGRRAGFTLACIIAAIGAAIAFIGLQTASFVLFTAGCTLIGAYMSAQGFHRFAAADTAPEALQPRMISLVQAGGLFSALAGPIMARTTAESSALPFAMTFAAIIVLNMIGPLLYALLRIPVLPQASHSAAAPRGRSLRELLRTPEIAVAMICAMVAYALMNLVMTSTPLAMVGCGYDTGDAANVVSAHIVAMFAPAFFTGHLITRFGARRVVAAGLLILAVAGGVALTGVELDRFYLALILLGVGWNFGIIGATAMLTAAHRPEERGRIQGVNDAVVFGGVFLASLSSGGLMGCAGGTAQAGWSAVNMAMVPFLILAGSALIWLTLRPRETR